MHRNCILYILVWDDGYRKPPWEELMDFLSYKLRCYTRISALKKGVTTQGKKYFFTCVWHRQLAADTSLVLRATRSGFFFTFSLLFFIFLHITRYSFDPRIANANRGGSNLFIYVFIFYWLHLITPEIKRKWRNIT